MNCRKKCRKWWRSRRRKDERNRQGFHGNFKWTLNSSFACGLSTGWRSTRGCVINQQFANDSKEFANSEKQFANDTKEFANEKKETVQEVKQRKVFVKAKRAICKLITTNPKVTTAQIAVVYPRTISPEPQKYDFWVKVILHIIVFPW